MCSNSNYNYSIYNNSQLFLPVLGTLDHHISTYFSNGNSVNNNFASDSRYKDVPDITHVLNKRKADHQHLFLWHADKDETYRIPQDFLHLCQHLFIVSSIENLPEIINIKNHSFSSFFKKNYNQESQISIFTYLPKGESDLPFSSILDLSETIVFHSNFEEVFKEFFQQLDAKYSSLESPLYDQIYNVSKKIQQLFTASELQNEHNLYRDIKLKVIVKLLPKNDPEILKKCVNEHVNELSYLYSSFSNYSIPRSLLPFCGNDHSHDLDTCLLPYGYVMSTGRNNTGGIFMNIEQIDTEDSQENPDGIGRENIIDRDLISLYALHDANYLASVEYTLGNCRWRAPHGQLHYIAFSIKSPKARGKREVYVIGYVVHHLLNSCLPSPINFIFKMLYNSMNGFKQIHQDYEKQTANLDSDMQTSYDVDFQEAVGDDVKNLLLGEIKKTLHSLSQLYKYEMQ